MQYVGLRAIARQMGVSTKSIIRMHVKEGFLMWQKKGKGTRINWVSDDDLIAFWKIEQSRKSAREYRIGHRREDRTRKRQNASGDNVA
jgi:hypothetical protein